MQGGGNAAGVSTGHLQVGTLEASQFAQRRLDALTRADLRGRPLRHIARHPAAGNLGRNCPGAGAWAGLPRSAAPAEHSTGAAVCLNARADSRGFCDARRVFFVTSSCRKTEEKITSRSSDLNGWYSSFSWCRSLKLQSLQTLAAVSYPEYIINS